MMMHKTAYSLVIIGALNWGLVGLFDFNLVSAIFGMWPNFEKLIYIIVGLAAIYELMIHMSYCRYCGMDTYEPMESKKVIVRKRR